MWGSLRATHYAFDSWKKNDTKQNKLLYKTAFTLPIRWQI